MDNKNTLQDKLDRTKIDEAIFEARKKYFVEECGKVLFNAHAFIRDKHEIKNSAEYKEKKLDEKTGTEAPRKSRG